MKTLVPLAIACASSIHPGLAAMGVSSASCQITPQTFVASARGAIRDGSRSRPDHFAGEISPYRRSVNFSAGSFVMGDFAATSSRLSNRLVEDILVGTALLLQSMQSPMDREIQQVVSSKFESYWD